jgi:hypothetical protein
MEVPGTGVVDVIDELSEEGLSLGKYHRRKRRKTGSYLFLVASKMSNCVKFSTTLLP